MYIPYHILLISCVPFFVSTFYPLYICVHELSFDCSYFAEQTYRTFLFPYTDLTLKPSISSSILSPFKVCDYIVIAACTAITVTIFQVINPFTIVANIHVVHLHLFAGLVISSIILPDDRTILMLTPIPAARHRICCLNIHCRKLYVRQSHAYPDNVFHQYLILDVCYNIGFRLCKFCRKCLSFASLLSLWQ